MAYFLVSGDEEGDVTKFRRLLEARIRPAPVDPRPYVRLEAENAVTLENYELEYGDQLASHRLNLKLTAGAGKGRISLPFHQPYTAVRARYDAEVRYLSDASGGCSYAFRLDGSRGQSWRSAAGAGWHSQVIPGITVATGSTIEVESECESGGTGRLDYVHLTRKP
jgi:hypothetical protein